MKLLKPLLLSSFVLGPLALNAAVLKATDVARSTLTHHPSIRAALEAELAAAQDARAASGGFDTTIVSDYRRQAKGTWRQEISRTTLEKPLGVANSTVYVGQEYIQPTRNGALAPLYNSGHPTTQQGSYQVLGARFSLIRNLLTDPRRTQVKQAELGMKNAEASRTLTQIELARLGQLAYWEWVRAKKSVAIFEGLLTNGEKRNEFLESRVKRGDIAQIVLTENEQYVASRRRTLDRAREELIRAEQTLSLFLRDESGAPVLVGTDMSFEDFPQRLEILLEGQSEEIDLVKLRAERPDLASLRREVERLEANLELARQDLLPKVDLTTEYYQRTTANPNMPRDYVMVLAQVSVPIERRLGQGKIGAARARVLEALHAQRLAEESFVADLQSLKAAIGLRLERARQSEIEVSKARELVETEVYKFKSGGGSLFLVNLREEAAAQAADSALEAKFSFVEVLLSYKALLSSRI